MSGGKASPTNCPRPCHTGGTPLSSRAFTNWNAMKRALILLSVMALSVGMLVGISGDAATTAPSPAKRGGLVHLVSFKFKPDASEAKVKEVEEAFAALKSKIPQIVSFEWGTNVSPEKHDKGFTHGFILTFHTAADRDAYLVHPAHDAFGKLVGPALADVFVIDFWSKS